MVSGVFTIFPNNSYFTDCLNMMIKYDKLSSDFVA